MTMQYQPSVATGLLTEAEVARILKCSVHKLRADRFYRRGVPYVKNGRCVRYRPEDVQRHIDNNVIMHGKIFTADASTARGVLGAPMHPSIGKEVGHHG